FSQPMLDIAVARANAARRHSTLDTRHSTLFIRADAERLPFDDAQFQIVSVGYGLRNLASWEKGLSEMQRIAAPGARILVLDFGKPQSVLWRSIYFAYLRFFVPCLGRLFAGSTDAYSYI